MPHYRLKAPVEEITFNVDKQGIVVGIHWKDEKGIGHGFIIGVTPKDRALLLEHFKENSQAWERSA